jgi:hypothetical protein
MRTFFGRLRALSFLRLLLLLRMLHVLLLH